MSIYTGSIFTKRPGSRRIYERELGTSYNIDKDEDVQREISNLEELATFVRRSAHRCDMTETFLENFGTIGGIHRKYTELVPIEPGSQSYKRFNDAIRKTNDAIRVFIQDCECKYRKRFY